MDFLDETNAAEYLRTNGHVAPGETVEVFPLTGGVSNQVLYVARPQRPGGDFVLKQARPQLRVPQPWFSSVERIWREVDVLRTCQELVGSGRGLTARTPDVLFEDRQQYVFAMSAAPREHRVWKQDLLAGRVDREIAAECGRLLGRLHAGTWLDADVERRLGDQKLFDELRIDPYYRALQKLDAEAESLVGRLIESLAHHRRSLVHADFSPKNLLVYDGGLMVVDFETGHFGDPAFDLGFFLSHLVLKSVYHAPNMEPYLALTTDFWQTYWAEMRDVPADERRALESRTVANFAGCAWARLDGKSRIDYLNDGRRWDSVRGLCRRLLAELPRTWDEVLEQVRRVEI